MKGMPRILVVDDKHDNRILMEAFLVHLGYQVILANDGVQALEKVRKNSPDVILLDIMMPKMDGFEVTRRLKNDKRTRIIPIVIITALAEVEDRVKALELGADDFLIKPVELAELKARVNSLLKVKAYNDHMIEYQKKLEYEVSEKTKQLSEAFEKIKITSLETVCRLSRAAECKDEDTGAHIQRMSQYAVAIANRMGFKEDTIENILYALPMHDIGKIGIPDCVLLKPAKLDPSEWKIMKQHTIIGGQILEGSDDDFIETAKVIALTHHERWDGSGYPEGLKGLKIPLISRIATVADVFDAMTSRRPYRKEPFTVEDTFQIIKEGRGSHFDPDVVDAFFAAKEEIVVAKEEYRDRRGNLFVRMYGKSF